MPVSKSNNTIPRTGIATSKRFTKNDDTDWEVTDHHGNEEIHGSRFVTNKLKANHVFIVCIATR